MIRAALTVLAAPVLALQGLWVVRRAHRLSEAAGPRNGVTGQGRPLRVLVVGDSAAAGVGVDQQDDAFIGQMVARLAQDREVTWRLVARCGATAGSVQELLRATPAEAFDIAVISVGVNDTKNGHSRARWRANLTNLFALLRNRFGVRFIFVSCLPPMGRFPILPRPLRDVLGHRAEVMDAALRDLSLARQVRHVPVDLQLDPAWMARDGFHPGPKVYASWGKAMAEAMISERDM